MKKQYILVLLLLMAFGVVSTMALNITTSVTVTDEIYDISAGGATGSITKVKAIPVGGDTNNVKLIFTLSGQTVAFDLTIDLVGASLNCVGATITGEDGTAGTHVLSSGTNTLIFTNIAADTTSWYVTIVDSAYTGINTVWEDIDSITVIHGDY